LVFFVDAVFGIALDVGGIGFKFFLSLSLSLSLSLKLKWLLEFKCISWQLNGIQIPVVCRRGRLSVLGSYKRKNWIIWRQYHFGFGFAKAWKFIFPVSFCETVVIPIVYMISCLTFAGLCRNYVFEV
jgi:hypothetical protein